MFKINSKNTFNAFFSVFAVDFEQVNISRVEWNSQ